MYGSFLQLCCRRSLRTATLGGISTCLLLVISITEVQAQLKGMEGVYQPMHQNMPPGMAGDWARALGKATPSYFQPIRIELPNGGTVSVYRSSTGELSSLSSPALIGVQVGHIYRLHIIAKMPGSPDAELYPTVEIIDRLHPPAGKAAEFSIPIQLRRDEIELALSGRMVTKVIYLEQPNIAPPREQPKPMPVLTLPAHHNLLAEADRLGRPMVILRIGGRTPDVRGRDTEFFGPGAPVQILSQAASNYPQTQKVGFQTEGKRRQQIIPSGYQYRPEYGSKKDPRDFGNPGDLD